MGDASDEPEDDWLAALRGPEEDFLASRRRMPSPSATSAAICAYEPVVAVGAASSSADVAREAAGAGESSDEDFLAAARRARPAAPAAVAIPSAPLVDPDVPKDIGHRRKITRGNTAASALTAVGRGAIAKRSQGAASSDKYQELSTTMLSVAGSGNRRMRTSSAIAEQLGIHQPKFQNMLYATACASYDSVRAVMTLLVQKGLDMVAARSAGGDLFQPVLAIRYRKYDGTRCRNLKVEADRSGGVHGGRGDMEKGPHELFVTEASFTMVFRRISRGVESYLAMKLPQPTLLQSLSSNKAECIRQALRQLNMPYDQRVDESFFRLVEAAVTDGASCNLRAERSLGVEHESRARIHLLCDAHKQATVSTLPFGVLKPVDTHLIRFALTTQGSNMSSLRREMRRIIREQLVVVKSGHCPADAEAHREKVYDLFMPQRTAHEKYVAGVARSLWNGDIRKRGRVEHYENGCCKSFQHTLWLMCNVGMQCLCGTGIPVLQRSNWTGTSGCLNQIGLPSHVHGILPAAHLRAIVLKPSSSKRASVAAANEDAPARDEAAAANGEDDAERVAAVGGDGQGVDTADIVSVWRQDEEERVRGTHEWLQSGCFEDDVLVARAQYGPTERMMLNQLAVSGVAWERKQQFELLQSGARTYQMLVAHEGLAETKFLEDVSDLMFQEGAWDTLAGRDEALNMKLFKLTSRQGAAGYELLTVRHRFWPYKTFSMLRYPGIATDLRSSEDCLLDEYTSAFRKHYGERLATGNAAAELMALLLVLETDTGSTEREHSGNERRNKFRAQTHEKELGELSAWYCTRRCCDHRRDVTTTSKKTMKRKATADTVGATVEGAAARKPTSCRRWSWTWRAYIHVQAKGRWLSPDVAAEISASYRALTQEERAYYEELGELAAARSADGDASFSRVRKAARRTYRATPLRSLMDDTEGAGPAAAEVDGACDGDAFESSHIVLSAKATLREARADDAQELQAADRERAAIVDHSKKAAETAVAGWSVVGSMSSLRVGAAVEPEVVVQPSPLLAMTWERSVESVADATTLRLHRTTAEANAQRWRSLHKEIRLDDCPMLGLVPTTKRPCHEAQRCVCKGNGVQLAAAVMQFKDSLRIVEKEFPGFRKSLKGGAMVARLCWGVEAADAGAEGAGGGTAEAWFHIALFYERPIRPTFLQMERDSARDEGDLLGIVARPPARNIAAWQTMWEAFGDVIDYKADAIELTWYSLDVIPHRKMAVIRPSRQRVRRTSIDTLDLRKLPKLKKPQNKRPATKPDGRAHGRGDGRGRGGRGRARGARGGDVPALEDGGAADGGSNASSDGWSIGTASEEGPAGIAGLFGNLFTIATVQIQTGNLRIARPPQLLTSRPLYHRPPADNS